MLGWTLLLSLLVIGGAVEARSASSATVVKVAFKQDVEEAQARG
jgi:hypothetical protein